MFNFIICKVYNTKVLCWIMLDALLLRLCSQDVKGWLLRLMLFALFFDWSQRRSDVMDLFFILWFDVKNHISFLFFWFMMLLNLFLCHGSWWYGTKNCFRFRCYKPMIIAVGEFRVTTLPDVIGIIWDVGGFRGYHHARCYLHYLRCNSGDLASILISITPDEELVETRWKLVKEKIFGSILEKMLTFDHILT